MKPIITENLLKLPIALHQFSNKFFFFSYVQRMSLFRQNNMKAFCFLPIYCAHVLSMTVSHSAQKNANQSCKTENAYLSQAFPINYF